MGLVRYNDNPKITDVVLLDLPTPGSDDCFAADPYKVERMTVYRLDKDFSQDAESVMDVRVFDPNLQKAYEDAQKLACDDPTAENISAAQKTKEVMETQAGITSISYNRAIPVKVVGTDLIPAWISSDPTNALIVHDTEDADGNPQYGRFHYEWKPEGLREGNYLLCYSYEPLAAGGTIDRSYRFTLASDIESTTATPYHRTAKDKYQTILERYTPEMYKLRIGNNDLTPDVIQRLNQAVGDGFTLVEDLAGQIIDILNATSTHQAFLPYLANLFDLRLRSDDQTRWRRQIKKAIPLFKKKGTLAGLEQALDQAGIKLKKLTKLWQVISKYTWVDAWTVETVTMPAKFPLTKIPLAVDPANFSVAVRPAGESEYVELSPDYVTFVDEPECLPRSSVIWTGESQVVPVSLMPGDVLKVMYQYREVPSLLDQQLEDYIRLLPLSDQRDETLVICPKKNWNVRLIEEDDPLFDAVIESRNPFFNFLVFGRIRTELPYSENLYNRDEYNGSLRDSLDPCDIDCDFLDPCFYGQSSKFSVDVEIDRISTDRLNETRAIILEYSPFHAVLQNLNAAGSLEDIIPTPAERIEKLVQYKYQTMILGGEGQMIFNRARYFGLTKDIILRDALALTEVAEGVDTLTTYNALAGTATNLAVALVSPDARLDTIGLSPPDSVLEILSPFVHAGVYQLSNISGNTGEVVGWSSEPLNQSAFVFRLSNEEHVCTNTAIEKSYLHYLSDSVVDFSAYAIKSATDVAQNGNGPAWKVSIPAYSVTPYTIDNVLPDGRLVLQDPLNTLPSGTVSGVAYSLLDSALVTVAISTTGQHTTGVRAKVTFTDGTITDARGIVEIGDYLLYSANQYRVSGFVTGQVKQFYIEGYSGSDVTGVTTRVYRRLLDQRIGYLGYKGLGLTVGFDLETDLRIQNGTNPPASPLENNRFRQNFLIQIGDNYYAIKEIDGGDMVLDGPPIDWTLAGTPVTMTIYRFIKTPQDISNSVVFPLTTMPFDWVDRRGWEFITKSIETGPAPFWLPFFSMAADSSGDPEDVVEQSEKISFQIEYKDGTVEKGEL